MQQPDFEDMENKDEIQSREFNKQWSVNYTLKKEDVETLKYEMENGYCENGVYLFPYETYGNDQ
ncbi:hypothetical protein IJU97_01895 [bacterium]|nr:hypothetical protein [bacterium]